MTTQTLATPQQPPPVPMSARSSWQKSTIRYQGDGALLGGNICLLIACIAIAAVPLIGWVIAGPFILVSFILSIVAMSQSQTWDGVILLIGSFVCPIIAQVLGIIFWAMLGMLLGGYHH